MAEAMNTIAVTAKLKERVKRAAKKQGLTIRQWSERAIKAALKG